MNTKLDLSGNWEFKLDGAKEGIEAHFENQPEIFDDTIMLPGSTSLAKKGPANRSRETYFLTDVYKFEGYAWYRKTVELPITRKSDLKNKHFFLTLERTRVSYVWVDGEFAEVQDSFIAKHVYDLTGLIKTTKPVITVMISNADYVTSGGHMTSCDTQSNWNGILGEISLEIVDEVRISHVTTYCDYAKKQAKVLLEVDSFAKKDSMAQITVNTDLCILKENLRKTDTCCDIWEERSRKQQAYSTDMELLENYLDIKKNAAKAVKSEEVLTAGTNEIELTVKLPKDAKQWDEEEPYVYRIKVTCGECYAYTWFGLREFKADGSHFEINGRETFLRGRHQGMLFPLSGFAPMNVTGWLRDFKICRNYGINHERCHTCTPPEAAFLAADLLGFYMQPEIPFWGTWQAVSDENYSDVEAAQDFLTVEGFNIINEYAGHPSFVMMSMGNELWGSPEALNELLGGYKAVRPDIMYTQGSNNFQWVPNIQPNDDFFSGVRFTTDRQIRGSYAQCDAPLGRIQKSAPSTSWNYDDAINPSYEEKAADVSGDGTIEIQYGTGVKRVRLSETKGELIPKIPVVSHEIGQYFVYPDYNEISHYKGALQARNLEVFQERLEDMSLTKRAEGYFKSSGALAMACYKEELEAALRSSLMAGFQILDLQDYTGQGTALVGPLNSLMENKGIISAEKWRSFCSDAVVLGEFDSYVLENGGLLKLDVKLAYYRKAALKNTVLKVTLTDRKTGESIYAGSWKPGDIEESGLYDFGSMDIRIPRGMGVHCYDMTLKVTADCNAENVIREVSAVNNTNAVNAKEFAAKNAEDTADKSEICTNSYTFWSYDKAAENEYSSKINVCSNIREVMDKVDDGKPILYYLDPKDNVNSIPGAYCTDFWNYPMFKSISESMNKTVPVGTLGAMIAAKHPALAEFSCETFSTPQWFEIIERSRISVLNRVGFRPIVTMIDNCERNYNLGMIYEYEIMDGQKGPCHVVVCTSPLKQLIAEGNAPAAALEKSILKYLESGKYVCEVRTNTSVLRRLSV